MFVRMKSVGVVVAGLVWLGLTGCESSPQDAALSVPLNVGKQVVDSDAIPLTGASLPMTLALSADHTYAVICGMGYRDALWTLRTSDDTVVSRADFTSRAVPRQNPEGPAEDEPKIPNATNPSKLGVYYGVVCAADGTVYAAQGARDTVAVMKLGSDGKLMPTGTIHAHASDFPAGVAVDERGHLFVTNNASTEHVADRVPASLAIYDRGSNAELGRFAFASPANTTTFPLGVAARRDGHTVYVASERDGVVLAIDASDPAHPTLANTIAVGSHPVSLLLNRDESRLFVANQLSDTVSVLDTAAGRVVGTVLLRPEAAPNLPGVTPTSLALSADEKTLFVTLADMQSVGVVDVPSLSLRGMMPAGWYPSAVAVLPNQQLLVINAKGHRARNPNPAFDVFVPKINRNEYILTKLVGDAQTLPLASDSKLADQTAAVLRANHLQPADLSANPLAGIGLAAGKIKHVIYIVKENRTYDQVLGDDPRGDGDASLAIFGRAVTPNLHALADRFVLLDNTYACGEVSGDGWVWSTQGMANGYVERNIPYHYSNRGRGYDFEGQTGGYITGGFPATDPDGKPLASDPAFAHGAPPIPDVGQTGLHLWDLAQAAHLSYRNYGFFLSNAESKGDAGEVPENYPTVVALRPPGHDLAGVSDTDFRRFDLDYADSEAPQLWADRTHDPKCLYKLPAYGAHQAPSRFTEWNHEFQEMLAKPGGDGVPALMTVRLGHDHTQGMSSHHHSPVAEVADNDYGVAQLVQAVSHSSVWKSTAIFVIEDDAQNGPDHVDCHRTTAYVISPWIKRGTVDHEFHNTDTLLKTMELLLGLPPMSQYDAIAKPITDWDTTPSNDEPFDPILPDKAIIAAMNVRGGGGGARGTVPHAAADARDAALYAQLQAASDQMDFIHPDSAPARPLNEIVWKSVRGPDAVMPAPRHVLLSPATAVKKDDDDD